MKRIILPILLLCCLALTSCKDDATIGIIGGADGPTAILVSDEKDNNVRMTFGEQYEKKPIRMFNVDGKGTKAGAATVVEMKAESAMEPLEPPKEVYLGRPFVYMLIDCETNLPFFIGTMMDVEG